MMTFDKAGRTFEILSSGSGPLLTRCKRECCAHKDRWEAYKLLPCGCHAIMVGCTCILRDKKCMRCGRVFIPSGRDWYEVADPHADGADAAARERYQEYHAGTVTR